MKVKQESHFRPSPLSSAPLHPQIQFPNISSLLALSSKRGNLTARQPGSHCWLLHQQQGLLTQSGAD